MKCKHERKNTKTNSMHKNNAKTSLMHKHRKAEQSIHAPFNTNSINNQEALLCKIKEVLIAKKKQVTEYNVVEACCETIIELVNRKRDDYLELLEIVFNFVLNSASCAKKQFITRNFVKMLSVSIAQHSKVVFSILKSLLKNEIGSKISSKTEFGEIFKFLLENIKSQGASNLLAKHFNLAEYFDSLSYDQKGHHLRNSIEILNREVDCYELIKGYCSSKNNENNNDIILQYLDTRSNSSRDPKSLKDEYYKPLDNQTLLEIVSLIYPDSDCNLKILIHILKLNKKNFIIQKSSKSNSQNLFSDIKSSDKLFELIRHELIDGSNTENDLLEFVSLLSDFILPTFIPLISEINSMFLQQNLYSTLLRNIASYIQLEDFIEIIQQIDINKHFQVFKSISNADLSVFTNLYKAHFGLLKLEIEKTSDDCFYNCIVKEDSLDYLLSCLPGFCNYCTDNFDNIENIIKIFGFHFSSHKNAILSALERLIISHSSNLSDCLVLRNPIEKETSLKILESIKKSNLLDRIFIDFVNNKNFSHFSLISTLFDMHQVDLSGIIIPAIMLGNPACISVLHESVILSIGDSLRLLPFFCKGKYFDFDFISRLVELCSSSEFDIQKRAYFLLYTIYSNSSTPVCICDMLYSSLEHSATSPSARNRMMLQYCILKNGCKDCKIDSSLDHNSKFFKAMVKSLRIGNAKCKKFAKEIIVEIMEDCNFRQFLVSHSVKTNPDPVFLAGCVECIAFILDHILLNQEYVLSKQNNEFEVGLFKNELFNLLLSVSCYSQEIVRTTLKIFEMVLCVEDFSSFIPEILKTVDGYVLTFSKKYNRELKNFCISAERQGLPLTKPMKTLLKFRNKSGIPKEYQVVKKKEFSEML